MARDFLARRAKGLRHDGTQDDFHEQCYVIVEDLDTFTLVSQGAGDELFNLGEFGFDGYGKSGIYTVDNNYIYKYGFSHIWIDVTVINRFNWGQSFLGKAGYYESSIAVSTGTGANRVLNLIGYHGSTGNTPKPFTYWFTATKYYTSPIPYSQIKGRNAPNTALEIASISFNSPNNAAKITIASDSAGEFTDFNFEATTGETFPFFLAFQPTIPAAEVTAISKPYNVHSTKSITATSPIGGTPTSHQLEGKVKLYTDATTVTPATGIYNSKIYFIIEPNDTI
ncbi:MAG TPA: hypothetical protein PLK91_00645 [Sphaerochaeta sp.]|nr:hypothetical protein [Sphaerochaeta sp.]HOQ93679.1 hypothetical protein [Sphaerochaeta sp.]HPK47521.1 hypothetical protein [Sphaerochaeta sp.]